MLGVLCTKQAPITDLLARAHETGVRNPTYFDTNRGADEAWGITGHPTVMIVDAKGTVVRCIDWIAIVANGDQPNEPDHAWQLRLQSEIAAELDELLQ